MSNLSNLMISGSYKGLINLEDSTQNLASQSGDVELQDGLGNNIGLRINAQTKEFTVENDFRVEGSVSGSINGNVENVSIASNTASFDCSLGNFFTLTLPSGSTQFEASNIVPGQTISVKINTSSNTSIVTTNNTILFPSLNSYTPTQISGSIDLLSFVSFNTSELLGASINKLQ